jgi:hypothetical protein
MENPLPRYDPIKLLIVANALELNQGIQNISFANFAIILVGISKRCNNHLVEFYVFYSELITHQNHNN